MHRSGRLEQLVQRRGRASGLGHTLTREKPRLAGEVAGAGADVEPRLDLGGGVMLLHLGPVGPLGLMHQVFTMVVELLAGKVGVFGDVFRELLAGRILGERLGRGELAGLVVAVLVRVVAYHVWRERMARVAGMAGRVVRLLLADGLLGRLAGLARRFYLTGGSVSANVLAVLTHLVARRVPAAIHIFKQLGRAPGHFIVRLGIQLLLRTSTRTIPTDLRTLLCAFHGLVQLHIVLLALGLRRSHVLLSSRSHRRFRKLANRGTSCAPRYGAKYYVLEIEIPISRTARVAANTLRHILDRPCVD